MRLRDEYLALIANMPELTILGTPPLPLVTIAAPHHDIFNLATEMTARGWFMSLVAEPLAFQQTLTLAHERTIAEYVRDLHAVVTKGAQALNSTKEPPRRWEITTY